VLRNSPSSEEGEFGWLPLNKEGQFVKVDQGELDDLRQYRWGAYPNNNGSPQIQRSYQTRRGILQAFTVVDRGG